MLQKKRGYSSARSAGSLQPSRSATPILAELVVQRHLLAGVGRIGELPDQVGRTDQSGLAIRLRIVVDLRHRKAGQLDRSADPLDVEERQPGAAVADKDLTALNVPGSEKGVRGPAGCRHGCPGRVDDIAPGNVTRADAAQIADVVQQGSCMCLQSSALVLAIEGRFLLTLAETGDTLVLTFGETGLTFGLLATFDDRVCASIFGQ